MPEIEFAFLADAADVKPGDKFSVLGGGITRIGGPGFPLRHPHLALVVSVTITSVEFDREHAIDFHLLDPGGREIATATSSLVAQGGGDGADTQLTFAIDLWNLQFDAPGDHSFRILVNGSERKRLPLTIVRANEPATMPLAPPPGQKYEA